jgi:hypothetical protein
MSLTTSPAVGVLAPCPNRTLASVNVYVTGVGLVEPVSVGVRVTDPE